jgi:copper chaperone
LQLLFPFQNGVIMENMTLNVKGMTCGGCVRSVERVLKAISGVTTVDVSLEDGKVRVEYDGAPAAGQFTKAIEDAGFEVAP